MLFNGLLNQRGHADIDRTDLDETGMLQCSEEVGTVHPQKRGPRCGRDDQDDPVLMNRGDLEMVRQLWVHVPGQQVLKLHDVAALFQQSTQGRAPVGENFGNPARFFAGLGTTSHK